MDKEESTLQMLENSGMLDNIDKYQNKFGRKLNSREMKTLKLMIGIIYSVDKMGAITSDTCTHLCQYTRLIIEDKEILAKMEEMSLDAIVNSEHAQELRKKLSEKYLRIHFFLSVIADVAKDADIISKEQSLSFRMASAFLFAEDAGINND
jgi:hypothetical protein